MPCQTEAAALPPVALAAARVSLSGPFCGETARGAIYLAARYGLGVIVGVGNMLVMTWWIGPHAYGLFVTAVGMVAFSRSSPGAELTRISSAVKLPILACMALPPL